MKTYFSTYFLNCRLGLPGYISNPNIYTLVVQRPSIQWYFGKDHYFGKRIFWVWPPPSYSGKWRFFFGIPYWICNNPVGHCYWEGATPKVYFHIDGVFQGCNCISTLLIPRKRPWFWRFGIYFINNSRVDDFILMVTCWDIYPTSPSIALVGSGQA